MLPKYFILCNICVFSKILFCVGLFPPLASSHTAFYSFLLLNFIAVSKAQIKATTYESNNYDKILLCLSKKIKTHAESMSESISGFVNRSNR